MSHAKNKVWIHGVFSVKYRRPLINKNIRSQVYEMLRANLRRVGCHPELVGGIEDHVHVLFLLNRDTSISKAFQQMKGATSREINHLKLTSEHFNWQIGYAAFSVSESKIPIIERYIENQEEHHRKQDFQKELRYLIEGHGLEFEALDLD
ncbi:MAG: IS200/IS605 family transposase [Saprospiraceae bacterium]